ncbi:MAG: AsnC family transcriptional regulator [Solirubrobacteraceae bacterium]
MAPRSDDRQFFTNHARVLVCLAGDLEMRLRDVAVRVGVTERTAHDLVGDLERAGYAGVRRVGRRNHYEVCGQLPLRHLGCRPRNAGELIGLLGSRREDGGNKRRRGAGR